MKNYKFKKKKYDGKLDSQNDSDFKPITEKDINMAMAEIAAMAQMVKTKSQKAGEK